MMRGYIRVFDKNSVSVIAFNKVIVFCVDKHEENGAQTPKNAVMLFL